MKEKIFHVKDLGMEVGLSPTTIRKYTNMGLLEDRRDHNNWRIFSEADIGKIIRLCRRELVDKTLLKELTKGGV